MILDENKKSSFSDLVLFIVKFIELSRTLFAFVFYILKHIMDIFSQI